MSVFNLLKIFKSRFSLSARLDWRILYLYIFPDFVGFFVIKTIDRLCKLCRPKSGSCTTQKKQTKKLYDEGSRLLRVSCILFTSSLWIQVKIIL